ncbi:MAG: TonB-dependent receptor [Bacteroidales bacterium]|jgi:outer membrane receptor for ferrienterochelin and colicin|nr:TonB-dependent receptor [Bacteroidales bacterium]
MREKIFLSIVFILSYGYICSQNLQGTVFEYNKSQQLEALPGVNVYWLGTTTGVYTNEKGMFTLPVIENKNLLVVRYIGYESDTLVIEKGNNPVRIILSNVKELEGVTVTALEGTYISSRPILTQVITEEGLRRAACCNLSESFEGSASVDISYSDAITGAKQIQMLGLAGVYSQLMMENTPYIRGLSIPFGLMYVPGSWMESINISKGTASVINGYESITGQIDIQYKKPETSKEKLYLNVFLNTMLKTELNANTRIGIKENASTMFLFHFENNPMRLDDNKDGFLDRPLSTQVNFMNRWDYRKPGKVEGRTMVSYLYDTRMGGQKHFSLKENRDTNGNYGIGINNHKFNLISKNGILLKGTDESIGTIASFTFHQYNSFYGLNKYDAQQISGYANAYYENFIDKGKQHKINAGLSYQVDMYDERFNDSSFKQLESVPGIFGQYSFIFKEKLIAIAGFRLDYNSLYGLFWTPRIHAKWAMTNTSSLRATAGKGYRSPNIYIENTALMTSSRSFVISEKIKAEEAWNMGISFTQTFKMKTKECSFIVDYFYTDFVNQVIVDIDRDIRHVYFYNLNGKSYSHSAQAELIFYPVRSLEITAAYRYNNIKETINGELRDKPLASQHKAILNLSYATRYERWKFNITAQLYGSQRLPDTYLNPEIYQLPKQSPTFMTFNAQITKKFKYVEIYLGVENFTNYKQNNPIVAAENPFGEYFDASMIWGPISGAMGYGGIRLNLK